MGRENEEFSLEEIMSGDYESDESYSLESILAEFKSSAFIDGDKKTPSDVLQRKADEIIREVTGTERAVNEVPIPNDESEPDNSAFVTENEPEEDEVDMPQISISDDSLDIEKDIGAQVAAAMEEVKEAGGVDAYEEKLYSSTVSRRESFAAETVTPAEETDYDDDGEEPNDRRSIFKILFGSRVSDEESTSEYQDDDIDDEDYDIQVDTAEEAKRFSTPVKSLTIRSYVSAVFCVLILIVTHSFEKNGVLPFGLGNGPMLACGIVLILELIVMILGLDVLISGLDDLLKAEAGAESLVLISCVMTLLDGFVMLIRNDFTMGLPFSLVSSVSLFFTLCARRSYYKAMSDSLKMYTASSNPYSVITEMDAEGERNVIKKLPGRSDDFYKKLITQDDCEKTYLKATPLFVILSFILAILCSVGHGAHQIFAHCFGIMTSVSAAFPSAAAFCLPFYYAVSKMKKTGGAVSGWVGACEINGSDSALITDEDVFPIGTVSLSGIKLFEGVSKKDAVIYTASLIIESGSDLSRAFEELLSSQGYTTENVEAFSCYEGGGVSGVVGGERVLVGSGAFMNLMGIRVPESVNMKSAVFTAINDELSAVFTMNYVPANSVQYALISLLNTKVNVLLAVRDFNVTPNMIQQKFKVSMEGVEFIPVESSYRLSNADGQKKGASAILCREGLAPLAEVITRSRLLKRIADINTVISTAGTVIGILLMFFLCWTSSFNSATAGNAFIFMMAVELCVLLLSQLVKKR